MNLPSVPAGVPCEVRDLLAQSVRTLGHYHRGLYVINRRSPHSVKTLIRLLMDTDDDHEIRRYLGEAKVVQKDLIPIIKSCTTDHEPLFNGTIRLLTILTTSPSILYKYEIPTDKIGRRIYMNITEILQAYKEAFHDIDFWKTIRVHLTYLFETDWTKRSETECLKLEKMLILLRNVLLIPPNYEKEKITENDVSLHEKILWDLRQSKILEFLLYVTSYKNEKRYFIHMLEIFSLILRDQDPVLLADTGLEKSTSALEKDKDMKELLEIRRREKATKSNYTNVRTFDSTLVLKGQTSFSGRDMIRHGHLQDLADPLTAREQAQVIKKWRYRKRPVWIEPPKRRSSFSVRMFLKEFCIEFLNCSYNNLMSVVREKLITGTGLPHDEMYYFWALHFFLSFSCSYSLDVKLVSSSVAVETFHFLHTHMEENFEKLATEKKKKSLWVRKLNIILKAYHSLLETFRSLDRSKDQDIIKMSTVLKSRVFYVAEYRDIPISFLKKYDTSLYCNTFLRDIIKTAHLATKLLADYTKNNKIVVSKKIRKKNEQNRGRKTKTVPRSPGEPVYQTNDQIWKRIKPEVCRLLEEDTVFPDIPPYNVLLDIPEIEHKKSAMRRIQRMLQEGDITNAVGLLWSCRKMWPENHHFGSGASIDEEIKVIKQICKAELGNEKLPLTPIVKAMTVEDDCNEQEETKTDENNEGYDVQEETFDIMQYKKQFIHKKVIQACVDVLRNFARNSDQDNHCAFKMLFRIGWECDMPAMLYQASLFFVLFKIMKNKQKEYPEINRFTRHLLGRFRKHSEGYDFIYIDLLVWKTPAQALAIQEREAVERREVEKWKAASVRVPKIQWIRKNILQDLNYALVVEDRMRKLRMVGNNVRTARYAFEMDWMKDDSAEIKRLFEKFHKSLDVVDKMIWDMDPVPLKRSIKQTLLDLGLISSLSQLKGKRDGEASAKEDGDTDEEDTCPDNKDTAFWSLKDMKEHLEVAKRNILKAIADDDEEPGLDYVVDFVDALLEAYESDEFKALEKQFENNLGMPETSEAVAEKNDSQPHGSGEMPTSKDIPMIIISDDTDTDEPFTFRKIKRKRQGIASDSDDNGGKMVEEKTDNDDVTNKKKFKRLVVINSSDDEP